jgi:uncharacterized membrane protein
MVKNSSEKPSLLDRTFEISVALKGIDGGLEILGGILLLLMSPATIEHLFNSLANSWLVGSHQLIQHYIQELNDFVVGGTLFASIYLLAHGLVKVVLVVAVLKKQLWAYPVMIFFLVAFILYQAYLIALSFSIALLLLTLFDLFVVWLTWEEFGKLKFRIRRAA